MEHNDDLIVGAFVFDKLNEPLPFCRHAIVGSYAEQRPFVCHAGLLEKDQKVNCEESLPINHMGPPISHTETHVCHLAGQIKLTNEEIEAIDDWLASVSTQYRDTQVLHFQQYVICPHMVWMESEEGRRIRQRFSCVGYVLEAYRAAEIDLISVDNVPPVDRETLLKSYPDFQRIAENPNLSQRLGFQGFDDLGVPGDGPWQVVLAGYIFHSLSRYQNNHDVPEPFTPPTIEYTKFPLVMA